MRLPSSPIRVSALVSMMTLLATSTACDHTSGEVEQDDASSDPGGKADGTSGGVAPSQLCEAQTWLAPVPAAGNALMAFNGKAYVFARDGKTWVVVKGETGVTEAIPFPEGIVEMKNVTAEIAPSGRPLVTFTSEGKRYAAFFNGNGFERLTAIGNAATAHADAKERIYAIDATGTGLVEYGEGQAPIVRGGLIEDAKTWGVDAAGTVYVFYERTRPSTIHSGGTARDLRARKLPHGTLAWTDETTVLSNEGQGFPKVHFAAGLDGSVHVAYDLKYGSIIARSKDGHTWEALEPTGLTHEATLVDVAGSVFDDDPRRVKGGIVRLSAQDYDSVTLSLGYHQGSFSVPGLYHLRSCAPFVGFHNYWPAERFAAGGGAFTPLLVAVDERGLTSIVTPYGVRQNVVTKQLWDCDGGCTDTLPQPPDAVPNADKVPTCAAADVHGPIEVPVALETAEGVGHPLMPVGDAVGVFLPPSTHWMQAIAGSATTLRLPDAYAEATYVKSERSMSGGTTVLLQRNGGAFVAANAESAVAVPCDNASNCTARVAGDGHVWVADTNLYEQVGDGFETRGGFPVPVQTWDVDVDGNVFIASKPTHANEFMTFWILKPGSGGWNKLGALPRGIIDELSPQIEGGFELGEAVFAADGSFHLLSSARCVGTGLRNKQQFYVKTPDYATWEVEALPGAEKLANDDDQVGWRYADVWAASYTNIRYTLMTSDKPVFNGWDWNYPSQRQLNVVERCRNANGVVTFAAVAQIRHPGWGTKGFHLFSQTGVASLLTADGLWQVY